MALFLSPMSTITIDFANDTRIRLTSLLTTGRVLALLLYLMAPLRLQADDGYELWLKYTRIADPTAAASYRRQLQGWRVVSEGATAEVARTELRRALPGLF